MKSSDRLLSSAAPTEGSRARGRGDGVGRGGDERGAGGEVVDEAGAVAGRVFCMMAFQVASRSSSPPPPPSWLSSAPSKCSSVGAVALRGGREIPRSRTARSRVGASTGKTLLPASAVAM
uniref:Uncharacterized protein n=1 Tax=Triticum urartu TaxID=4572 RepID=A0A8R7PM92_TRIUA